MSFWIVYDHLGRLIGLNVLSLTLVSAPLWIGLHVAEMPAAAAVGLAAACACVVAAGQAALVQAIIAGRELDGRHLLAAIRRFGPAALGLYALYFLALGASGTGIWFYGSVVSQTRPLAGFMLAQLCACTGALALMAAMYGLPALLAQGGRPLRALKISVMLVARHPVASAGLLLAAGVCGVFALSPPGLVLLSTWPAVALACCAYELLARHHDPETAVDDAEDDYLNRGFRDFLFPWVG